VKDAVKATKSDVELLDALNKELVPPDLANDDGEVCAVEDIETEEDVAAATGDGEHLPVASTLTGWPEVPLPSVMPRPEGIALIPAGMGPPGWVLRDGSSYSCRDYHWRQWWKHRYIEFQVSEERVQSDGQ
jgi:hypothetical protein